MKVAAIQMNSVKCIEQNLLDAYAFVKEAANLGARLIVLPEMFLCFGIKKYSDVSTRYCSEKALQQSIGAWAKEFNAFIVAGSVPYNNDPKNEKVYASSFIFSDEGSILGRYDKIHLFDANIDDEFAHYRESDAFLAGESPKVVSVGDTLLGMSICYDLRFPELFQHYQAKSCRIISIPSAFTYETGKQHWEILLRARAIETQSYVIAANQVGVHEDGRRTWGHSMIVSPSGEILAQIEGSKPGIAIAELDFKLQDEIMRSMPLQKHKRL